LSTQNGRPLISIIIVNYKVPQEICQLLRSIQQAELYDKTECIIVDNASDDNSQELVTGAFPHCTWIALKNNIGFGKACNVGSQSARGDYLLFINPDTLVSHNTLRVSVEFLESHPDIGIMGPKIIKPDGSFQPQCRRSFPTPFNAFAHFSGLSRLFPQNPRFGQYKLNHVSPDIALEVDAVSGSYLFIRHGLFKDLGGFDKAFFMYGEDLDLCVRCRQLGYKVWYNPDTQIVHFKGKSSTKNALRSRIAFWEAMIIFSKKYRHSYGAFFPGWFLTINIVIFGGLNIAAILFKSIAACFIDLFFINGTLWAIVTARFYFLPAGIPYISSKVYLWIGMHIIMSISFLLTYIYQGIYSSERYSKRNAFIAGFIASILFFTGVFFIKAMAFSRMAFALSAVCIPLVLVGWRIVLPRVISRFKEWVFTTGNVVILGNGPVAAALIKEIELDKTARITGIIWPTENTDTMAGEFEGYPVLGTMHESRQILNRQKADLLLIATAESWYSAIIEALAFLHLRHLTIRWVPNDLFEKAADQIPSPIPLNDFSV
jgi:GT2 family glycosyltransferase